MDCQARVRCQRDRHGHLSRLPGGVGREGPPELVDRATRSSLLAVRRAHRCCQAAQADRGQHEGTDTLSTKQDRTKSLGDRRRNVVRQVGEEEAALKDPMDRLNTQESLGKRRRSGTRHSRSVGTRRKMIQTCHLAGRHVEVSQTCARKHVARLMSRFGKRGTQVLGTRSEACPNPARYDRIRCRHGAGFGRKRATRATL